MASTPTNYRSAGSEYLEKTNKMVLTFEHVPTAKVVSFPAYLEMFSDAYNTNWNAEEVYGRMDPIATFINTRRALSISWNVPADSYAHAQENLTKANKILSFLYPLYDVKAAGGATAINQGPLLRLSFGNLVRDANTGKGLLGYVNGFTFDPNLEMGMFYNKPSNERGARTKKHKKQNKLVNFDVEYYPKAYRLNCEFTVLHEHALGFRKGPGKGFVFGEKRDGLNDMNFPYGVTSTPAIDAADRQDQYDLQVKAANQVKDFVVSEVTAASRQAAAAVGSVGDSIAAFAGGLTKGDN
jgi:hypothetical protein